MTPIGPGLLSHETILFNRLIRRILPKVNGPPLFYNYNADYHNALKLNQNRDVNSNETFKEHTFIPIGSTAAIQREGHRPWINGKSWIMMI